MFSKLKTLIKRISTVGLVTATLMTSVNLSGLGITNAYAAATCLTVSPTSAQTGYKTYTINTKSTYADLGLAMFMGIVEVEDNGIVMFCIESKDNLCKAGSCKDCIFFGGALVNCDTGSRDYCFKSVNNNIYCRTNTWHTISGIKKGKYKFYISAANHSDKQHDEAYITNAKFKTSLTYCDHKGTDASGKNILTTTTTKANTCTENGSYTWTCSACGSSGTGTLPATGQHNYVAEHSGCITVIKCSNKGCNDVKTTVNEATYTTIDDTKTKILLTETTVNDSKTGNILKSTIISNEQNYFYYKDGDNIVYSKTISNPSGEINAPIPEAYKPNSDVTYSVNGNDEDDSTKNHGGSTVLCDTVVGQNVEFKLQTTQQSSNHTREYQWQYKKDKEWTNIKNATGTSFKLGKNTAPGASSSDINILSIEKDKTLYRCVLKNANINDKNIVSYTPVIKLQVARNDATDFEAIYCSDEVNYGDIIDISKSIVTLAYKNGSYSVIRNTGNSLELSSGDNAKYYNVLKNSNAWGSVFTPSLNKETKTIGILRLKTEYYNNKDTRTKIIMKDALDNEYTEMILNGNDGIRVVDKLAPVIKSQKATWKDGTNIATPINDTTGNHQEANIIITAEDNYSENSKLTYLWVKEISENKTTSVSNTSESYPYCERNVLHVKSNDKGIYILTITDEMGNEIKKRIGVGESGGDIDIPIWDTEPPKIESITVDPSNEWATSRSITVNAFDAVNTKTTDLEVGYIYNNTPAVSTNLDSIEWTKKVGKEIRVTQNGYYYFFVKDKAGNISVPIKLGKGEYNNNSVVHLCDKYKGIDFTAPYNGTYERIDADSEHGTRLELTVEDTDSGIEVINYYADNDCRTLVDTADHERIKSLGDNQYSVIFEIQGQGDFQLFECIDKAGNVYKYVIRVLGVDIPTNPSPEYLADHLLPCSYIQIGENRHSYVTEYKVWNTTDKNNKVYVKPGVEESIGLDIPSNNKLKDNLIEFIFSEGQKVYPANNVSSPITKNGLYSYSVYGFNSLVQQGQVLKQVKNLWGNLLFEINNYDETAPVVEVKQGEENRDEASYLFINAKDSESGVRRIYIKGNNFDGSVPVYESDKDVINKPDTYSYTKSNGNNNFDFKQQLIYNGTYTVTVEDMVGNKTSKTIEITKLKNIGSGPSIPTTNKNNINLKVVGKGMVSSAPAGSAVSGNKVYLSYLAEEGYHFEGWTSSDVAITQNDTEHSFEMPDKAVTITGKFVKDDTNPEVKYPVTVYSEDTNKGTVKVLFDTEWTSGSYVYLQHEAKDGYRFKNWVVEEGSIDIKDNGFKMPEGPVKIKGCFETYSEPSIPDNPEIQYNINVHSENEEKGSAGTSLGFDKSVRDRYVYVTYEAKQGYKFDHWECVKGGINEEYVHNNNKFMMPSEDVELVAYFVEDDIIITEEPTTPETPAFPPYKRHKTKARPKVIKGETDIDLNNDGIPDLNIDSNGNGLADTNIDYNKDNEPNINVIRGYNEYTDVSLLMQVTDPEEGEPIGEMYEGKKVFTDTNSGDKYIFPDWNNNVDDDDTIGYSNNTGNDETHFNPTNKNNRTLNIDSDNDEWPDTNIDLNGDGIPDVNINTSNDNSDNDDYINIDTDGDGIPDVNVDTDNDGNPDTNIDLNGDGESDHNIADIHMEEDGLTPVFNKNAYAENKDVYTVSPTNYRPVGGTVLGDLGNVPVIINWDRLAENGSEGKDEWPDTNIDLNGDDKPDLNIWIDLGNGKHIYLNVDLNNDGIPDINVDTDGNYIADTNIDYNGDVNSIPDINVMKDYNGSTNIDSLIAVNPSDVDANGMCNNKKVFILTDDDGNSSMYVFPDWNRNIDDADCTNNMGDTSTHIAPTNWDVDGDGNADYNIDTNGDGYPDKNIYFGDLDISYKVSTEAQYENGTVGGGVVGIAGSTKVKPGENVQLVYMADDGYSLKHWQSTPTVLVQKNNFTMPESSILVIGVFKEDSSVNEDINIDTDGDGIPDLNVDTNSKLMPDTNLCLYKSTPEKPLKTFGVATNNKATQHTASVEFDGEKALAPYGFPVYSTGSIVDDTNVYTNPTNWDKNHDGNPDYNIDADKNDWPESNVIIDDSGSVYNTEKYTVKVIVDTEGGKASIVGNELKRQPGETVTVAYLEDYGYMLESISSIPAISITTDSAHKIASFAMPYKDITIHVKYKTNPNITLGQRHVVKVSSDSHSTGSTVGSMAYAEGETVRIAVYAYKGYAIDELEAVPSEVDINVNSETRLYEFTMPNEDVTIKVHSTRDIGSDVDIIDPSSGFTRNPVTLKINMPEELRSRLASNPFHWSDVPEGDVNAWTNSLTHTVNNNGVYILEMRLIGEEKPIVCDAVTVKNIDRIAPSVTVEAVNGTLVINATDFGGAEGDSPEDIFKGSGINEANGVTVEGPYDYDTESQTYVLRKKDGAPINVSYKTIKGDKKYEGFKTWYGLNVDGSFSAKVEVDTVGYYKVSAKDNVLNETTNSVYTEIKTLSILDPSIISNVIYVDLTKMIAGLNPNANGYTNQDIPIDITYPTMLEKSLEEKPFYFQDLSIDTQTPEKDSDVWTKGNGTVTVSGDTSTAEGVSLATHNGRYKLWINMPTGVIEGPTIIINQIDREAPIFNVSTFGMNLEILASDTQCGLDSVEIEYSEDGIDYNDSIVYDHDHEPDGFDANGGFDESGALTLEYYTTKIGHYRVSATDFLGNKITKTLYVSVQFFGIEQPDPIIGLPNGTKLNASDMGFPETVKIKSNSDDFKEVPVVWDFDNLLYGTEYDAKVPYRQTFVVGGKAILPDYIIKGTYSTDVFITVNVNAANEGAHDFVEKYSAKNGKSVASLSEEMSDKEQYELNDEYAVINLTTDTYSFTGSPIEPKYSVNYKYIPEGKTKETTLKLVENKDYVVSIDNNINAGIGTIRFSGTGDYIGTIEKQFTIVPKVFKNIKIEAPDFQYTGSDLSSVISKNIIVMDKDYQLDPNDYVVEFATTPIGSATDSTTIDITVKASETGNYRNTLTVTSKNAKGKESTKTTVGKETISKVTIVGNNAGESIKDATIELKIPKTGTLVYTGKYLKPVQAVTIGGVKLNKKQYAVVYKNNKEAGTATVYVVGKNGYYGTSKPVEFTISPKPLAKVKVSKMSTIGFRTNITDLKPILKDGKRRLVEGVDYVFTYDDLSEWSLLGLKGKTATITVHALEGSNYEGDKVITLQVTPRDLKSTFTTKIEVEPGVCETIYDSAQPVVTVKYNDQILALGKDYTVEYKNNTVKATKNGTVKTQYGTATITGVGNYTGKRTIKFPVTLKNSVSNNK